MVRIEFSDCTYSIVRCIANEDTDEEEIIENPPVVKKVKQMKKKKYRL